MATSKKRKKTLCLFSTRRKPKKIRAQARSSTTHRLRVAALHFTSANGFLYGASKLATLTWNANPITPSDSGSLYCPAAWADYITDAMVTAANAKGWTIYVDGTERTV